MQIILTDAQRREAYAKAKEHFGLKHQQRTKLDNSPMYLSILVAVHHGEMAEAFRLLQAAGIIA